SAVELPPVPAMIGMRPRACCTPIRISSLCSSKSTVGDSPVVPTTTMPSVPSATCQSISLRKRGRSSPPSFSMGVTIATRLPVIMGAILPLDGADPLRHGGLGSRDFAFLESEHFQCGEGVAQFPGPKQEIRVRRPAEALVADHERLVDEHPALRKRIRDRLEERAVQIVGNDDAAEALTCERPGGAVLEIRLHERHAGNLLRLAVDRD